MGVLGLGVVQYGLIDFAVQLWQSAWPNLPALLGLQGGEPCISHLGQF